jgi:hypothetical protein
MKRFVMVAVLAAGIGVSATSNAAVSCMGKVSQIYKWNHMTTASIRVVLANGTVTNWVNLPAKSDEAMAMMALASDRDVEIYWQSSDITSCSAGWSDNRALDGYLRVFGSS